MMDGGIFYSKNYLKFIEETSDVNISVFQTKKNGDMAFLPYYIQDAALFGLRYGGIVSNSDSKEFMQFVSDQFLDYCRGQKVERISIRNNPFEKTLPIGNIIKKEPLALIDLTQSLEELKKGFSKQHQKRLATAKSAQLTVFESRDIKYLILFYKFYKNLLERKGEHPTDIVFFEKLYFYLKKNLNLIYIKDSAQVIAVSIILESKPNVYMLYGGMNGLGYQKCAKYLMIYNLMKKYMKKGYTRLILGTGVDGKQDSIYQFKRGFTDQESYVYTYGTNL